MTEEKFCFCLNLESGCLLLGFTTFLLSIIKIPVLVLLLKMNGYFDFPDQGTSMSTVMQHMTSASDHQQKYDLRFSKSVVGVFTAFVIIVLLLWTVFSVLMIIGILKKKINFVMTYFLFGIAISILFMLSGLLEAIRGLWATGVVTIILTLLYIKCLTSVYAAYDQMRQGKASDLEQLIDNDDPMIEC